MQIIAGRGLEGKGFEFAGRWVGRGDELNTDDFPQLSPAKWAQLFDHGYFFPEGMPRTARERQIVEEQQRRQREIGVITPTLEKPPTDQSEPRYDTRAMTDLPLVESEKDGAPTCGDCGYLAKDARGLKTHQTRKHSKE